MRKNIIIAICPTAHAATFSTPPEKREMKMGERLVIKVEINVLGGF